MLQESMSLFCDQQPRLRDLENLATQKDEELKMTQKSNIELAELTSKTKEEFNQQKLSLTEKEEEIERKQKLISDIEKELVIVRTELHEANEKSLRLETRLKQSNKNIEELSKSKKSVEDKYTTVNDHQEVLRKRIKIAESESQRYKDLSEERNSLISVYADKE